MGNSSNRGERSSEERAQQRFNHHQFNATIDILVRYKAIREAIKNMGTLNITDPNERRHYRKLLIDAQGAIENSVSRAQKRFAEHRFDEHPTLPLRVKAIMAALQNMGSTHLGNVDEQEYYRKLLTEEQQAIEAAQHRFDAYDFEGESNIIARYQAITKIIANIDVDINIIDPIEKIYFRQLLSSAENALKTAIQQIKEHLEISQAENSRAAAINPDSDDESEELKNRGNLREIVIHRNQWVRDKDERGVDLLPLGQGAFGKVYAGRYKDAHTTEHSVAIKSIEEGLIDTSQERETFFNEASQLVKVREQHGNQVVFLYGISKHRNRTSRVAKYSLIIEKGEKTLAQYLNEVHAQKRTIPLLQKVQLALDIARGLTQVHNCNVIHGDLKDTNILLFNASQENNYVAKISDFGLSRISGYTVFTKTRAVGSMQEGTQCWQAPEVVLGIPHNPSSDLFSYALLVLRIATDGKKLFEDNNKSLIPLKATNLVRTYMRNMDFRPSIPADCDETLKQVIEGTWRSIYKYKEAEEEASDELQPMREQKRLNAEEVVRLLEQKIHALSEESAKGSTPVAQHPLNTNHMNNTKPLEGTPLEVEAVVTYGVAASSNVLLTEDKRNELLLSAPLAEARFKALNLLEMKDYDEVELAIETAMTDSVNIENPFEAENYRQLLAKEKRLIGYVRAIEQYIVEAEALLGETDKQFRLVKQMKDALPKENLPPTVKEKLTKSNAKMEETIEKNYKLGTGCSELSTEGDKVHTIWSDRQQDAEAQMQQVVAAVQHKLTGLSNDADSIKQLLAQTAEDLKEADYSITESLAVRLQELQQQLNTGSNQAQNRIETHVAGQPLLFVEQLPIAAALEPNSIVQVVPAQNVAPVLSA